MTTDINPICKNLMNWAEANSISPSDLMMAMTKLMAHLIVSNSQNDSDDAIVDKIVAAARVILNYAVEMRIRNRSH
jgi:hypothetical protein